MLYLLLLTFTQMKCYYLLIFCIFSLSSLGGQRFQHLHTEGVVKKLTKGDTEGGGLENLLNREYILNECPTSLIMHPLYTQMLRLLCLTVYYKIHANLC